MVNFPALSERVLLWSETLSGAEGFVGSKVRWHLWLLVHGRGLSWLSLIRPFPCDWGCQCYSYVSSTEQPWLQQSKKKSSTKERSEPNNDVHPPKRGMDISPLENETHGTITTPQWSKLWSKKGINLSKQNPKPFFLLLWAALDFAESSWEKPNPIWKSFSLSLLRASWIYDWR